ncbi:MAG TPA: hypothetical protein VN495_00880 [Candidatus Paceibacterota bacterium]|nr:hypothetical protein [Candidatus Paceibacterota bacterium]
MTLVESMVWIAVFTFAMLALSTALISFYRTNSYAIQEASATAEAQKGMDAAVRVIRVASYASNGAYPVVSIAPNQFTFYAAVVPNDPQIQKVRLFVATTSLYEGLVEPSGDPFAYNGAESIHELANAVRNIAAGTSTFLYYDQNGNLITDYSQFASVRFVEINLVVDSSTTSLPTALMLRSSAALRNLVGQ